MEYVSSIASHLWWGAIIYLAAREIDNGLTNIGKGIVQLAAVLNKKS
jgi:hypothetical protein